MATKRSHGKGSVVKQGSGIYAFYWTDAQGRRHKKSLRTKSKKEALEKAAGFEKAVEAKDRADVLHEAAKAKNIIESKSLPFTQVWDEFLRTKPTASTGTLGIYKRALDDFIEWLKNERPNITSLTRIELETTIAFMEHVWESGVAASTYNDKRNALGHITSKLANRFGIDNNYWPRTERKKAVQQKRLPLSNKQTKALLETLDGNNNLLYPVEMASLVKLCLFAGMRLGDAVNIRWDNIDFETAFINYTPSKTARTSGVKATVPILPILQESLNRLDVESDWILPQVHEHFQRNPDYIKEKLIMLIHSVTGDKKNTSQAQSKRKRSLYGVHSLRHTFATEVAKAGATSVQLSRMTGDLISTLDKFYVECDLHTKPISGFNNILKSTKQVQAAVTTEQDSERRELHQLADIANIEHVRDALELIKAKQASV